MAETKPKETKETKVHTLQEKLWAVKLELPKLKKETKGFKFMYTTLGDVEKALRPLLVKRKLGYEHKTRVCAQGNILVTNIFCLENENAVKTVELLIPEGVSLTGMNAYQSLGSAITYFKRYNLVTGFGVLTEDDVDAQTPQKTVKEPNKKVDHVAKMMQLVTVGRKKASLEKYYTVFSKEMDEAEQKKAKDLIAKL